MVEQRKEPNKDLALGQSVASLPEMQALKTMAFERLNSGENRDSVFAFLQEATNDLTTDLERMLGFGQLTAIWLLDWAETGEPGALDRSLRGTVCSLPLRDENGEVLPVVLAIAGPTSDPEEIAEEFLVACRKTLSRECFKQKPNSERDARWFRLHKEGMSYREIARLYLKEDGFDQRAASDEDWKQELDAWTARVNVACLRWHEHLTRLTDFV